MNPDQIAQKGSSLIWFHIVCNVGHQSTKTEERADDKTVMKSRKRDDLFVCFVALRPKSTAMVIAGRSVHLTTLFPGQA